jgi:hypothetical protein
MITISIKQKIVCNEPRLYAYAVKYGQIRLNSIESLSRENAYQNALRLVSALLERER